MHTPPEGPAIRASPGGRRWTPWMRELIPGSWSGRFAGARPGLRSPHQQTVGTALRLLAEALQRNGQLVELAEQLLEPVLLIDSDFHNPARVIFQAALLKIFCAFDRLRHSFNRLFFF